MQSNVFPSVCVRLSIIQFLVYVNARTSLEARRANWLAAWPGRPCAAGGAAEPVWHLVITGLVSRS